MSSRSALVALLAAALGCKAHGVAEEIEIGRSFTQRARQKVEFMRDPVVAGYVREIGASLIRAAGPQPYPYHFYVVVDETANAVSAPGGYVFLHTGTLLAARTSGEVAAILAHEVGHVVGRHGIRKGDQRLMEQYRGQVARVGPDDALGRAWSSSLLLSSFSRELELEADRFAAATLLEAGYCPEALISALTLLLSGQEPLLPDPWSSHPELAERVAALRAQTDAAGGCPATSASGTDRLPEVQAQLAR